MIKILFPYIMQLHILQLEEYKVKRFVKWVAQNFNKRSYIPKKPLVWTSKAKFIYFSGLVYALLLITFLAVNYGFVGFSVGILAATQPYIFLTLGVITLKPYELINRQRTVNRSKNTIKNLKINKLKVIGITGSYGKTSVKEFLYQILRSQYKVLRTPESYNTLFGIAKVIEYELDSSYDFFICEMGAYKIGEIKELCQTVLPDHAVITGINEQHIDRFKKIENTIKAKFEIAQYSNNSGILAVNGLNANILNNVQKYRENAIIYGVDNEGFYVRDVHATKFGTTFNLILNNIEYPVGSKLIGNANIENILAASTMAYLLGTSPKNIVTAVSGLQAVPHRLEIKEWQNGLTVIDDAYSSNLTGFKTALELLSSYDNCFKILATPGIVELGNLTREAHRTLGSLAESACDQIFLIGSNERTQSLYDGIANKNRVTFVESLTHAVSQIEDPQKSVLLIENDLPDNY